MTLYKEIGFGSINTLDIDETRMCSTSFLTKYKVLEKIGEGSFSEVLKCQNRQTHGFYAAKRLKATYHNMSEIMESPEVMAVGKISRHPNVLYMVELHYDSLRSRATLVFELMDMSLYDLIINRNGLMTESRVKNYIYQLLKGLEHLHKHCIFHRDIKPENILLKDGVVKIGDLGSVRGICSRPPYTAYISTRWYRSPECLLTGGYYGPKMDIWAAGCVFYELFTLEPLFPGANEVDQITKIHFVLGTPHAKLIAKLRRISSRMRNGGFYFPPREGCGLFCLVPNLSSVGLEILGTMLAYDPETRASAKRLLQHRYFADSREAETTRLTRSATGGESNRWRCPVIFGYLTSERHRRLRCHPSELLSTCRSQLHKANLTQYQKTVELMPNARLLPKVPEPGRLSGFKHAQVGRYFLRKRQNLQNNRVNGQTKKCESSYVNLIGLRYCDKHSEQRENLTKSTSVTCPRLSQSSSITNEDSIQRIIRDANNNRLSSSMPLPPISSKSGKHSLSYTDSSTLSLNDRSRKVNLSTIREGLTSFKPARNDSTFKTNAKRDITSGYYLRSTCYEFKKFHPKRSLDQLIRTQLN